jgi:EAL domain-containing protein (putative c-di-GMP-specific phosphodiesterase class I)
MSRQLALPDREVFPGVGSISLPTSRRGWYDRPGLVLVLGGIATALLAYLEVAAAPGSGRVVQNIHVLVASATTTLSLAIVARRPAAGVLRYRPLVYSVALTGAAMATLDLAPSIGSLAVPAANGCLICGATLSMAVILPSLYRRLDRRTLATAGLDGGIMVCAGMTLMLTLLPSRGSGDGLDRLFVPVMATSLLASAGVAAIVAFTLRAAPAFRGVWSGIVAVSIIGLSGILWADQLFHGDAARQTPTSLLYSGGILLIGYAWMTWNEDIGGGKTYDLIARSLVDWLPIVAIVLCVGVAAVPHARIAGVDPAPVGTAAVVLLSLGRQRLLIVRERWASVRLTGEVEERAQTMLSLARLEPAATLELTGARICDEALRLDGIEAAAIFVFGPLGNVLPLALAGDHRPDDVVLEPLTEQRSLHLRACAGAGAWIDPAGDTAQTPIGPLLAEAYAPMRWEDHIVGVVSMGTTSREDSQRLATRLPTLTEFGVVSSALLGPMLAEYWRLADIRSQLETVITDHAFVPVFQAVVRLQNRETVGFEALTRFRDGTRPDQRFIEADRAGMSVRLETACLGDQLEAATWLPQGTWVSLNVSPALAGAIVPLIAALERADRDVVLEITEHVEIDDYRKLVGALDLVRGKARLAVDDAGAGYAGLRHILELKPQFVKLDLSLVRHVDTDPARQAMVAGMAHFARNSGCELIAEGIETEEELNELIRLGVSLGQGYLFGKPGPIVID